MAKITCGSLIRRAGGLNILGTAGCLVQWPGKTDQLLLLTAARVLVGRTAEQFEAIEAVDLPGKPIGCLYAWSDLKGPTTADVALVHVDPALVDAGIGPSGAPKGTNLNPKLGDKLTIFADGKAHNLTITSFGDKTIDRVAPDSRASVNYLNQIICDPATEDRCVGAMAMDGSNNIVGMVVGGDGRAFTLVTPIDALLSCTFGGPEGPALEVRTSVPATAKAPEKVTHPDHVSGAQTAAPTGPGVVTVARSADEAVGRCTNIFATQFGGRGDTQKGAYGGMVDPHARQVALPARLPEDKRRIRVRVASPPGPWVECQVTDVGPWNTRDKYWDNGARPMAEAQRRGGEKAQNGRVPSNEAGIDLTPAVFEALRISDNTRVDWEFV